MVIVDTSVWITHLREGNSNLKGLLLDGEVACHPFIIGELACGAIKNRNEILSLLRSLPMASVVTMEEFLYFIDRNKLMGMGVSFVDVHLLASAQISGLPLWTFDKRLKSAAVKLNIAYK